MIFLEIPLLPETADQTLDVTIDSIAYTIRVLYNVRFKYFSISIGEKNSSVILQNIKMVCNFPLVKRFGRLPMAGDLFVLSRNNNDELITFESLQAEHALYYFDAQDNIDPVPKSIAL